MMKHEERQLLDELKIRQRQLDEHDGEFARRLNVPRQTWQLTRTGVKPIRRKVALAAMRAFPELTPLSVSFLLSDASHEAIADTVAAS